MEHSDVGAGSEPKTSCALVLVGNAETSPLTSVHVDMVRRVIDPAAKVTWLAENEACEILFESASAIGDLTGQARAALSGTAIDAVCMPAAGRRKKILVSDMDSTVISQECIDELGDAIGVGPQIRAITAEVVNGGMNFSEALRRRMALMKGMDFSLLEEIYADRITLQPGARTFVQTMRHHGAHCVLVSGGFTFFTSRIAERVGFHENQGNELLFSDGKLTGEISEPILGRSAKLETVMRLCEERGLAISDVLAVGDGANDIKMIEAAGLGVAYHGAGALRQRANACIDHGDLTALLYIQGYRKSEFVTS